MDDLLRDRPSRILANLPDGMQPAVLAKSSNVSRTRRKLLFRLFLLRAMVAACSVWPISCRPCCPAIQC